MRSGGDLLVISLHGRNFFEASLRGGIRTPFFGRKTGIEGHCRSFVHLIYLIFKITAGHAFQGIRIERAGLQGDKILVIRGAYAELLRCRKPFFE